MPSMAFRLRHGALMDAGELCNREVIICSPDETVREAAERMRDRHVGSLVVVEGAPGRRVPVGILTDRDIVIYAVATGEKLAEQPIRALMSDDIVTAREGEDVSDVIQ